MTKPDEIKVDSKAVDSKPIPKKDLFTRLSSHTLHQPVLSCVDIKDRDPESFVILEPMEVALRALDRNTLKMICQYPVLIDSGSGLSIMQWIACQRAGFTREMLKKCRHEVMTGFGGDISIMGLLVMPFLLGNVRFHQAMHIIPDDSHLPLAVLGVDWLQRHQVAMDFTHSTLTLYGVTIQMGKPRRTCSAYGVVSDSDMAGKRPADFPPWQTTTPNADGSRRVEDQELYDQTVELMRKAEMLLPEVWEERDHVGRRMIRNVYSSMVETMLKQSHDAKLSVARRLQQAQGQSVTKSFDWAVKPSDSLALRCPHIFGPKSREAVPCKRPTQSSHVCSQCKQPQVSDCSCWGTPPGSK